MNTDLNITVESLDLAGVAPGNYIVWCNKCKKQIAKGPAALVSKCVTCGDQLYIVDISAEDIAEYNQFKHTDLSTRCMPADKDAVPMQRVTAIQSFIDGVLKTYGDGYLIAHKVPDIEPFKMLMIENPCIKLDSGRYVWGFECWWGSKEQLDNQCKAITKEIIMVEPENIQPVDYNVG